MFPGLTTKVSEANIALATTIAPLTDVSHVTDTTSTTVLATIVPPFGGFSGIIIVINRSGANITTVTTGNIATAVTIAQNLSTVLVFSMSQNKWYPGAIS